MPPPVAAEKRLRSRIGANVRRLRSAAGLTLEAASERAGMNWKHWQKVESGTVNLTVRTIVRLAEALDVDAAELLVPPPPPAPPPPAEPEPAEAAEAAPTSTAPRSAKG